MVPARTAQEGIVVNLPSLRAEVPELDAILEEIAESTTASLGPAKSRQRDSPVHESSSNSDPTTTAGHPVAPRPRGRHGRRTGRSVVATRVGRYCVASALVNAPPSMGPLLSSPSATTTFSSRPENANGAW